MMNKPQKLSLILCLGLFAAYASAQLQPRSISSLDTSLGQNQPLPLEQAFPYYVSEVSPGQYRVTWDLAPGHYLYRHAFAFALQQQQDADDLQAEFQLPDGLKKTDQFFGEIEAYYDQVSAELSLPSVPGPDASLVIEYQGCADWGFCYPPQRALFKLNP